MTKNHLIIWPDKTLELVSKPVDHLSRFQIEPITIEDISKGMFEVMYANKSVGLSAIQIGVQLRMFVMDCSKDPNQSRDNTQPKPMVCINPVIEELIDEPIEMLEGCLSFPGIFEKVMRHPELIFSCEDLTGEVNRFHVAGLEAQCVQHEIQHLDGVTFATNWGNVTKGIMKRKIKKILG
jgi:peptide deformylase